MAITVTTLSAAIDADDQLMTVASATGFSASVTSPTVALIDDELVDIQSVSGTTIGIMRGTSGTRATAHGSGRAVLVGSPADFNGKGIFANGGQTFRQDGSAPLGSTFPDTVATATAVTLTPGQVLNGLILEDPAGGAVTATLPTAALMVAATPGAQIGTTIPFHIRNTADGAETITVAVGTGGTGSGTLTIAQNNAKSFFLRFTNVTPGSEAYTLYSLGTVVF